jgi:class 3 adenylate cyclase/HAMP domain-containing protein
MRIRSKVLIVVLPLLLFPAFLIGYTGFISAKNGITKVTKEFLSYKTAEMYKFCSRQEDILVETGLADLGDYREIAQRSAVEYAEVIRLSETGFFMAFNRDGTVIFPEDAGASIADQPFFEQLSESTGGLINFNFSGEDRVGYFLYFEPWDWLILLSEQSDVFFENANNIRTQVIYTITATLVFAIGIILFFVRKVTDPIQNVVGTMKDIITSNDLSKRVRVEYDDEVGYLSTWFNRMIEDLESAYNQVKQYAYKSVLAKNSEERIRHIFQKYVPGEVIDEVLKSKGENMLIGKKQVATILFSDIRSFTSISERLSAEELVTSLNTYFNIMVGIIMDHKGIIDKFIGDAIMALFGAPVQYGDDPLQSIVTGISMIEALKGFNKSQVRAGRPVFKIGIGMNTGEVVVGNIGSNQKLEYTCIGDAVNLASRLEGLTKVYGVPIIISEYTLQEANNGVTTREIDAVRVKGKVQPVKIYEPYGKVTGDVKEGYEIFNDAISRYQSRNFEQALKLFTQSGRLLPNDMPSTLYIDRCRELIQHPPVEDWDGVYTAKTK